MLTEPTPDRPIYRAPVMFGTHHHLTPAVTCPAPTTEPEPTGAPPEQAAAARPANDTHIEQPLTEPSYGALGDGGQAGSPEQGELPLDPGPDAGLVPGVAESGPPPAIESAPVADACPPHSDPPSAGWDLFAIRSGSEPLSALEPEAGSGRESGSGVLSVFEPGPPVLAGHVTSATCHCIPLGSSIEPLPVIESGMDSGREPSSGALSVFERGPRVLAGDVTSATCHCTPLGSSVEPLP